MKIYLIGATPMLAFVEDLLWLRQGGDAAERGGEREVAGVVWAVPGKGEASRVAGGG
jgi:hypothetical protein